MTRTRTGVTAVLAVAALALTACGGTAAGTGPAHTPTSTAPPATLEITDNNGTHSVQVPPAAVVALDNRTFETLSDWGITPTAAARTLMPSTNPMKTDESIVDIGNHREPNLEAIVAAQPDLIVNGQRFTQFADDIAKLAPDAVQLSLDPRDGEPLDAELKRQTTVLGQVFDKNAEAEALNKALDDAVAAAKAAYPAGAKVMAVNVSGGNIGYIAPGLGRTLGPVFDMLGLTPALEVAGASDDHQGDDISVEAIADSNPDWILVMDRDAAISADDPSYVPANTVLENAAALSGVTAVQEGNIVYMPADTYVNEGIQTYTEFLQTLAKAFSGQA